MERQRAIVRAFGGEPLIRVVIGCKNGVFFVARPDRIDAIESGDSIPVGFHAADVFEFDEARYQVLASAWRDSGFVSDDLWNAQTSCRPLV